MFEHRGVAIEVDNKTGEFRAKVHGRVVYKPSIHAMRKHIDKSVKSTFTPFSGLSFHLYYGHPVLEKEFDDNGYVRVSVFAIDTSERIGRSGQDKFLVRPVAKQTETLVLPSVIRDTPENRALLAKIHKHNQETRRIDLERREQSTALLREVNAKHVRPSDITSK